MPKVKLHPQGLVFEAPKKSNLLHYLHSQNVPVGSACGGKGLCGSCKVIVLQGEKNLSRPNDAEIELSARNSLQLNERIACQCKILGDLELTTSYW